jgi:MFS transporter, YNFM family, putative membrane transport protein
MAFMSYIKRGTKSFRMANLALFAGGFNTFAILWSTQPLLPEISKEFHLSPAVSSLTLSCTTIALAISMLFVGSLSEVFGRKPFMTVTLLVSSIIAILTAISPNFHYLLFFRILQGIVLAGLPAIAMAYLGEEIDPPSLGMAMGLYISGNSIGGMSGRFISGAITDYFDWKISLVVIGVISLVASFLFWVTLPKSVHFKPRKFEIRKLVKSQLSQFKEPGLIYLFGIGFLLMGSFVALYNYIGFQLLGPPYHLSQTMVGFIFVVYLVGTFSSTWMGMLADQYGRRKILQISLLILLVGACITLDTNLWLKFIGLAVFTFGFFAGHSIASGWIGKLSKHDKAQASSLYLFFYYVGSSIGGTAGGIFYKDYGWVGVIGMIIIFAIIAVALSIRLAMITKKPRKIRSMNII